MRFFSAREWSRISSQGKAPQRLYEKQLEKTRRMPFSSLPHSGTKHKSWGLHEKSERSSAPHPTLKHTMASTISRVIASFVTPKPARGSALGARSFTTTTHAAQGRTAHGDARAIFDEDMGSINHPDVNIVHIRRSAPPGATSSLAAFARAGPTHLKVCKRGYHRLSGCVPGWCCTDGCGEGGGGGEAIYAQRGSWIVFRGCATSG